MREGVDQADAKSEGAASEGDREAATEGERNPAEGDSAAEAGFAATVEEAALTIGSFGFF
jgi:hypothetical protein